MVDLEPVRPPGVAVQVRAALVLDVGRERQRLPRRQVARVEVVDLHADRMKRRAVDGVARAERIEGGRRCRAEPGPAVGDDDDVALVAEQLARRDGHQQADQREVEDDVAELPQIALLRGDFDGRCRRRGGSGGAPHVPDGASPPRKPLRNFGGDGLGVASDLRFVVLGQPGQVPRRGDRRRAQAPDVLEQPGRQTAHQRHEQQHVDGREPEAGEHVEGLQPVEPRADDRMLGEVLVDLGRVQAALRQQRTGYRAQRQQEQQHQRRTHRRQGAPGVPNEREQTQNSPDTPVFGGFCVCSRGCSGHSGSRKSLTKASRTHEMNSFHSPVTSAIPTRMSSTPPRIWMVRV